MSDIQSNNKRIAKNTIFLYLRMLITIIVGLFTSRVVLATLGVEDYGIYGLVGSVITMLSFLNASMSAASSRFITFELGKGNIEKLRLTFSSAVYVHAIIAVVIFIIAETGGLWFFYHKLVIPEARRMAAMAVYQVSVFSAFISIIQAPYNALIIAYERMNFYAYVEILNSVLKLLIVYLLLLVNLDKLILYSLLVFGVHLVVFGIYIGYCRKNYEASKLIPKWDMQSIKPLLSYTSYDLYGGFCVTARQQGINFVLNMFFGVAINAACSVASTVYGLVTGLGYNVFSAISPQIIKQYAVGNYREMENFMSMSLRYSIILFMMISAPCIFEMNFIMTTWLGTVPDYAVRFCQISLILNVVGLCNSNFNTAIHATGNIKYLSIVTGSLFLLSVPLCYIVLKCFSNDPIVAYSTNTLMFIPIILADIILVRRQIPELSMLRLITDMLRTWLICALPLLALYYIHENYAAGIARTLATFSTYCLLAGILIYLFELKQNEKEFVKRKIMVLKNRL